MNDTSGSKKRGWLLALSVVALMVILILVSKSPATFLNWFFSILAAFSGLLLFVLVFALVLVVIAAILRRYREKQRQETHDEPPDQRLPQSRMRRSRYIPRQQEPPQSIDDWQDSDC